MTTTKSAFFAYGELLGAMRNAYVRVAQDVMAGFVAGQRRCGEAAERRLAMELSRHRVAEFDVDAAQTRLDDLGRRNRELAARWGVDLGGSR